MHRKGFVFIFIVFLFATIVQDITGATQNKIYWVELGAGDEANQGKVRCANLDGSDLQDLVTDGLSDAWGIALDVDGGKMYWTDRWNETISRADLNGTNVQTLISIGNPDGIALDVANGKMYWTDTAREENSAIKRADLNGTNVETLISTGLLHHYSLALDVANDKMYWTEWGDTTIKRSDLNGTNIQTIVDTGLIRPNGIALDVANGKMYWTDEGDGTIAPTIKRSDLNGTNIQTLVDTGLISPNGIVLDVANGKMFWTDYGNDTIKRADLNGQSVQTLLYGLSSPTGIALRISGSVPNPTPTSDTVVGLSPTTVASPNVGDQLTFSLNIADGENIAGYQATITYDATALRYVQSENGTFLPTGAFFIPRQVDENTVQIAATSLAGETMGDGILASIIFEVVAVKESTVRLSDVILTNSSGETTNPQTENAEITEPPSDDHGDARAEATDLPLDDPINGAIENETDVDYFRVDVPAPGSLTVWTTGDLDTTGELQYSRGAILQSNEDGGTGTNFRIYQRSLAADTYYIKVMEQGNDNNGTYTLHASFTPDAPTQAENKIYWMEQYSAKVRCANLDGSDVQDLVIDGFSYYPQDIALDVDSGKMYWTEWGGTIKRADLNGQNVETLIDTGLSEPKSIALDVSNGKMYWTDPGLGNDTIKRSDLNGTNVEILVDTELSYPFGITLDVSGGKMYWTDRGNNTIKRSDLNGTNVETLVYTGLSNPESIALDVENGKMYWTDWDSENPTIKRSDLNGTNVETLVSTGLGSQTGIALDVSNGKMYWTDWSYNTINRSDLNGTNIQTFLSGLNRPQGIALSISSDVVPIVLPSDDHGDTRAAATNLPLDDPINGAIEIWGDVDYFRVVAPTAGSLTVLTTGSLDTAGELQDSSGTILQSNNNSGITGNFGIQRTVAAGTYYVKVIEEGNNNNGTYTLNASFTQDTGTTTTAGNKIYWIEQGTAKILCADLDGSNVWYLGINDLVSPQDIALDVNSGKIYWIDTGNNTIAPTIKRADLNGINVETLVSTGLNNPESIALDVENGKMYWTDWGWENSTIKRADLNGINVETLVSTGLNNPESIALDVENGKMYWTDWGWENSTIKRADLNGTNVETLVDTGLVAAPSDIALDVSNGKMYWTELPNPDYYITLTIKRADLNGQNVETIVDTGISGPYSLALDVSNGKMYWTDSGFRNDTITRADLNGENVETLIEIGLDNPIGIAVGMSAGDVVTPPSDDHGDTRAEDTDLPLPTFNKIYWVEEASDENDGDGKVRCANLDGSDVQDLVTSGLKYSYGFALDVTDDKMYWTDWNDNTIKRSDLNGENVETLVSAGLSGPFGITLDVAGGKMYWTEVGNRTIKRADLNGENVQTLVDTGVSEPRGIALDVSGGKMYWTDSGFRNRTIKRADLNGENVQTLVDTEVSLPSGIALDVDSGKMYWTDWGTVKRADLNGENVQTLIDTGLSNTPDDIALDVAGGKMYWTDRSDMTIKRSDLNGTNVQTLLSGSMRPTGIALGVQANTTPVVQTDVNDDSVVDIQDIKVITENFGQTGENAADVNNDGVVDVNDIILVLADIEAAGGSPLAHPQIQDVFTTEEVQQWLIEARLSGNHSPVYLRGIAVLEQILALLTPQKTMLLANYPNPFNPETWIPYRLAKPGDVILTIYAVNGQVVRTLELGHQASGFYEGRNRAAHWDGKNAQGEPVASGIYFYTLIIDDFSSTRRMLILK